MSEPRTVDRPRISLTVQLVWEAILLLLVVVVTVLAATVPAESVFAGPGPWPRLAVFGLPTIGLALSLRTGTPNLAVGAISGLTGVIFVKLNDSGWAIFPAILVAVLLALVFGLILASIVGLTGTPAWAVSLAGLAGALTLSLALVDNDGGLVLRGNAGIGAGTLRVFAALVVIASLAGGVLWLAPGLRRALSGPLGDADPGRFSAGRLVAAAVGLGGSSLLAGLGGVLSAGFLRQAQPDDGLTTLIAALGAVLIGGISVHGRDGGIAGTVLGIFLIDVISLWVTLSAGPTWAITLLPATLAILVGILAGWLIRLISGQFSGTRFSGTQPAGPVGPGGPSAPPPVQPASFPTQPPAEPWTPPQSGTT